MWRDRWLALGVVGALLTCLACVTPVALLLLGAIGLGAWTGRLDVVLLPLLVGFVALGVILVTLLGRARELRAGDDRHVQLARQLLKRARDVAHLGHLAFVARGEAVDELEVVDDDQVEALLCVQAARFRPDLDRAHDRRVVDVDLALGEDAHGVHDLPLLSFGLLT